MRAVGGHDQRIDLDQARVAVVEEPHELAEQNAAQ
jgi:hypothetical protein